ncbi:hypothetical protein GASC598P17_001970 [Gilliamella apis SCGC AB-598-P17]|nr:hypothetical protein GASC598P17_001970 [Gilliamella apis SCGC AB-598-P17]
MDHKMKNNHYQLDKIVILSRHGIRTVFCADFNRHFQIDPTLNLGKAEQLLLVYFYKSPRLHHEVQFFLTP